MRLALAKQERQGTAQEEQPRLQQMAPTNREAVAPVRLPEGMALK
jgi:hypothetical protein